MVGLNLPPQTKQQKIEFQMQMLEAGATPAAPRWWLEERRLVLTVEDIAETAFAQLELQLQSIPADLPGIVAQAHRVRGVVHAHAR